MPNVGITSCEEDKGEKREKKKKEGEGVFDPKFGGIGERRYLCVPIVVHNIIDKSMAVIQVTSREFREKQASMFALADKGEQVVIRRRGKVSYMLTPVYEEDFALSPELEERIETSRRQYREGQVTTCTSKEELDRFLDEL